MNRRQGRLYRKKQKQWLGETIGEEKWSLENGSGKKIEKRVEKRVEKEGQAERRKEMKTRWEGKSWDEKIIEKKKNEKLEENRKEEKWEIRRE